MKLKNIIDFEKILHSEENISKSTIKSIINRLNRLCKKQKPKKVHKKGKGIMKYVKKKSS
jgi:predicted transcriptional regulator